MTDQTKELMHFLKEVAEAMRNDAIEVIAERFKQVFPTSEGIAVAFAALVTHFQDGEDITEDLATVSAELQKAKLA